MIDYEMQRLKSSFEVAGSVVLGEILLTERAKLSLNLARKISICQAAVTHSDRTDDEHMAGCCFMFGTIDTHVLRDENFNIHFRAAFGAQFSGSFFISSRCRGCYVAIDTNSPPAENRRAVSEERRKAHVLCELNILKSVFSQNTKGPSSNKQQKKIRTADMRDSIEHNVMEFDPIPARLCYLATCYITESNRSRLDVS
ncbi:hypothetical protein T4B_6474 [Trichinella pseudospiralis]|uniref:Uncharacterized protein n=1 Tax=Trichinella pseudospiralis TaxID=6337 RepID=A0A0V1IAM5_TRIPS|nr:hypothetical protein T4B_6474 [Trichinella pseudospiralis]